jgi:hypothetical protein
MKITESSEWLVNNHDKLVAALIADREARRAAREAKADAK